MELYRRYRVEELERKIDRVIRRSRNSSGLYVSPVLVRDGGYYTTVNACSDVTDKVTSVRFPDGDPDLLIEHFQRSKGLTGTYYNTTGSRSYECDNFWDPDPFGSDSFPYHDLYLMNQQDADNETISAIARTNPSRPSVSIPAFIGELRELPSQIYDFGKKQLRNFSGGSNTIAVEFGLLPLVSDVIKLSRLSDETEKRNKLFRRLEEGKQRTKVSLGKVLFEAPPRTVVGDVVPIPFQVSDSVTVEKWAIVHWILDDDYSIPISDGERRRSEISDVLLGISKKKNLYGYLSDTWDLIPWTWLADWCGNMGDTISSLSNSGIASHSDVWICQTTTSTRSATSAGGYQSFSRTTKQRFRGRPTGAAFTDAMSAKQVLILSSLAKSRHNRGG